MRLKMVHDIIAEVRDVGSFFESRSQALNAVGVGLGFVAGICGTMLIWIVRSRLDPIVKVIPLRVGLATREGIEILFSSIGFFLLAHLEVGRLNNGGIAGGTGGGRNRLQLGACGGTGSTGSSCSGGSGCGSISGRHLGKDRR